MQGYLEKKEHRLQFRFWLDVIRPEEDQLAEYVNDLKEKRSFAQTIREALHLIRDLRQGRVEVLLRLFPWIEDHFAKPISAPAPMLLPDPFREQLDRIERYFHQLPVAPTSQPMLLLDEPLPDEPTILMERVKDSKSGWNNLISMAGLTGNYGVLAPEILAYGLESGRIPPQFAPKKDEIAPKQMDVPQFALPVFDDDDDMIILEG